MTLKTSIAPPEIATPPVKLDSQGRIDEDIGCRKCGYNLRTLLPDSRCPECGTAVGRSLQGDLLRFAEPAWVQTLASGMNWIFAGLVLGILVGGAAGGLIVWLSLPQFLICCISLGLTLVRLVGYWKVSAPDPSGLHETEGVSVRKMIRVTQVAGFAFSVFQMTVSTTNEVIATGFSVVQQLIGAIGTYAIFTYGRRLALRIPDDKLARQCRIVMWALLITSVVTLLATTIAGTIGTPAAAVTTAPVTTAPVGAALAFPSAAIITGCIAGPVFLFFGLWSLRILLSFRKQFRQAASQALATWAAPIHGKG